MSVIGGIGLIAETILTASSNALSSLEGIATAGLKEGALCFVQENDGTYLLFPSDAQAPDGSTIVAATGGGNWILQSTASPTPGAGDFALLPRVIYVDAASTKSPETGSIGNPFTTLQAAINATMADIPTQINVVGGDYSSESLSIPEDRTIDFVAMAPPLQTVLGNIGVALNTDESSLRFDGFIIGDVTFTEGASPPGNTSNFFLHNCQTGDLDATSITGTSLYFTIDWESFLTGIDAYFIGEILSSTGLGGDGVQVFINNATGPSVGQPSVGNITADIAIFMSGVNIGSGSTLTSDSISLVECSASNVSIDGISNGVLSADGRSASGITSVVNMTSFSDPNYLVADQHVIYVNGDFGPAGSGSPESPLQTIAAAVALCDDEDDWEIVVHPGSYADTGGVSVPENYHLRIRGLGDRNGGVRVGTSGDDWDVAITSGGQTRLQLENMIFGSGPVSTDINVTGDGGSIDLVLKDVIPSTANTEVDASSLTGGTLRCDIQHGRSVSSGSAWSVIGTSVAVACQLYARDSNIGSITDLDFAELKDCTLLGGTQQDGAEIYLFDVTAEGAGAPAIAFPANGDVYVDDVSNYAIKNGGSITNGTKNIIGDLTS